MAIVTKTVEVKVCDICGAREDLADDVIRKCSHCGKDFCSECGEIYVGQIGSVDPGVIWLCKNCVDEIVKFKDDDEDDEESEGK
jgi:hypothetical protein